MPKRIAWQGSVFARADRLFLKVKAECGEWRQVRTPYTVGQEREAEEMLRHLRDRLQAVEAVTGGGPPTVKAWGAKWLATRGDDGHDKTRLERHIYPTIGYLRLEEVRPRHLLELVSKVRTELAPRTVRNVYSVLQAMFRDAQIADLVTASPCVLRRPHLPPVEDRDPEWRAGAVFTRKELETLISPHPEVEPDSTVCYALLGFGMLRHGEMAGLRWRHYDPDVEPLGRLVIACSYSRRGTKTALERWMPVHPTLAAILAEWRLLGWAALTGRAPEPDDLVVPVPKDGHGPERMRSKEHSHLRFKRHLVALGLRHRRLHDLRRTGISLARHDGARVDVLRRGTHAPSHEIMELYTSVEWSALCDEVGKMKVRRPGRTKLVRFLVQSGPSRDKK